jgi:hypothetical protein
MPIVQLALGATAAPQLFWAAKSPDAATLVTATDAALLFVTVTDCVVLTRADDLIGKMTASLGDL